MHRVTCVVVAGLGVAVSAFAQAPLGTVQGRVLGPDGEPMVNIEVTARPGWRSGEFLAKARTDGEGMFVLAHVPAERGVQVTTQHVGHTLSADYAALSPEQPNSGVELRLYHANTLRGRIVDAEGKAIADAYVLGLKDLTWFPGHTMPIETRSDAEGRFELRGVPIGDCVVRVHAAGFAVREHELYAVADTEVQVPPLVREAGTTLQIATAGLAADLVAKTRVRIYATHDGTGFQLPSSIEECRLGADGSWRMDGLPDAEWHIELEAPGVTFEPRSVTTKAGERTPSLVFRASPDGSVQLRGRLCDAAGKPLANEKLVCRTKKSSSMNGGRPGRTTTDRDGRFVLDAPLVVGEPYSLHLVSSSHALQQQKVEGMAGKWDPRYLVRWEETADPTRELALVAVPAAHVVVTLRDTDKKPVPFQWTELRRHDPNLGLRAVAYATSSRDGETRFPGVHGMDIDLCVHAEGAGGAVTSEPFRVAPGDRLQMELVMTPPSRVKGRALDAAGKPLVGVRVTLRNWDMAKGTNPDGSWTNVPTDRNGGFVFTGVAPGGHYVEVGMKRAADGKGQCEPFEVAPGATAEVEVRVAR